ncbi:Alpha/Beta hydrolase protein [Podospora appendiculata]|uniref:Alpha/Beta hydrolase protein n=1 Tax=Podospora appendiculata TaxID=314037 RepID=A0AAE0XFW9_9PEZI|nr:Alpha/Beta hydrolase protein [Podospora appendiculata]
MASPITPFKIDIPDAAIESLKAKLSLATFPEEVPVSEDWNYGVPVSDLKRLAAHWKDGFDWRASETRLNTELPQFTTPIEVDGFGSLKIHFVHQKSERPGSIPLLFCHGWPGSFLEVSKILPLLTKPEGKDDVSFHVVAPSLPNFGFSEGPSKPGFGIRQYSECLHKLMLRLGYPKYVTQGGDWGFMITRIIGVEYPAHCLASHLNYIRSNRPTLLKHPRQYFNYLLPLSKREKDGLARTEWFHSQGYGYNTEQSTRPATIGAALADSPVALLAWVYEKLHDWTDAYPWTDDEVLTWISIYLFSTAGSAASVRIYYEAQNTHPAPRHDARAMEYNAKVKLGLSSFPKDLRVFPMCYGRTLGPVVFEAVHEAGGHFAAYEVPELLVGDLRVMFGERGGARDVAGLWRGE